MRCVQHGFLAVVTFGLLLAAGGCSKEGRITRHLQRADAHFERGDYDRARLEYLNVLKLNPAELHAIQRLGAIGLDQGALLQAAPYLNRAKELDPRNAEIRARLGQVFAAVGDLKNARAEAHAALDLVPDQELALQLLLELPGKPEELAAARQRVQVARQRAGEKPIFLLADAAEAVRQRDLAGAQAAIGRALALDPNAASAHFMMGNLLWAQTNLAAADHALATAARLSPLRSARRIRYAEFKLRTGAAVEGVKLLEELSAQVPDYLPALSLRAELAFDAKQFDECQKLTENILGRYPLHFEARLLSAKIQMLRGQAERAIAELESVTKVYGKAPPLRFQLAVAYLMNKDPAKALSNVEEALAGQSDYPEAQLLHAQLLLARGDADPAIHTLSQLVKARPHLDRAHLLLGEALAGRAKWAEARSAYQAFTQQFPQDPRGPFLTGLIELQQSRTNEARRLFAQAIQMQPTFVPAVNQLVQLDLRAGDRPSALARAQAFAASAPDLAAAQLLVGQAQMASSQYEAAEASFKRVLALDPDARPAYLALAALYHQARKTRQALDQIDAVIAKDPKDVGALMLKATILQNQGDYATARAAYEQLIQTRPDSIAALNNLAYLYSEKLNEPDKAFPFARRAYDLRPGEPHTADTLGWIYYRRGDYPQAIRLLLESAEKLPDEPEVQYHLGMTYYMMAQEEAAQVALGRAVSSPREFDGRADATERLETLRLNPAAGGDPAALAKLEARVKAHPDDVLALARLGDLYERQAEYAKARQAFEDVLKRNPNAAVISVRLARLYAERFDNRERAQALARKGRELAPGNPQVAWDAGRVALAMGDAVLALGALQEARQKLGARPDLDLDLAQALYLAGRISDAEAAAQGAAGIAGPHQDLARQLAWLIQAVRNPAAAAAQAESQVFALAKAQPGSVPALMALAGVHEQKGRLAEAAEVYTSVLNRVPSFGLASRQLAALYAGPLKDERKAEEYALQARKSLPADALVARTLGWVAYRRADYRSAATQLSDAAKERSTDAELFYYLGMAQSQLKQRADALKSLNRALELGLSGRLAVEAKQAATDLTGVR